MRRLSANEEIKKLIEEKNKYINIDSVKFGENNILGRDSCKLFKDILRRAKFLSNDPAFYVDEYFSKLKNKIDLTKEEYIQMIEEHYEIIINEVIELEKECKLNAKNKVNNLAKLIEETEYILNKWNESLKLPDFTRDNEWKSIRFDAAKEIKRIEDEIEKCQDDLLLNRVYEFLPIPVIDENNFGNFYVRNVDVGNISMLVDNFSKLGKIPVESKEFCIKGIPWVIKTKLETKDKYDYLGFYVGPNCDIERIKSNPIDTKCTLKICQNEARKTESIKRENFSHKFESPIGRGFCFIAKEEILNLSNGFYNKETDLILLDATIQVIN